MMQPVHLLPNIVEESYRLIALLEHHAHHLPFAEDELARHRALQADLEERQQMSKHALDEWRAALAQRWECEVAGQRLYLHIQRQIRDYFGVETPHLQVIAPLKPDAGRTAADLLADLQHMEASLALLRPQPPFVAERRAQLAVACANLDAALSWTVRSETQRRNALLSQRLAYNVYKRVRARTLQLLATHLSDSILAEFADVMEQEKLAVGQSSVG